MTSTPFDPADAHRRRLRCFARWISATMAAPDDSREAIVALSRRIDRNGMGPAEATAAIDALDALLSEVWDRQAAPTDAPT